MFLRSKTAFLLAISLHDIKRRTDCILDTLHDKCEATYSTTGLPSVPPERLLKAQLLMVLYSVSSESQLANESTSTSSSTGSSTGYSAHRSSINQIFADNAVYEVASLI
jgi:hypothetical protein